MHLEGTHTGRFIAKFLDACLLVDIETLTWRYRYAVLVSALQPSTNTTIKVACSYMNTEKNTE